MKLKSIKAIYSVLLILVLFIVYQSIPVNKISELLNSLSINHLALILVILIFMSLSSIGFWSRLLNVYLGRHFGVLELFEQYAMMSLGKYLPSGVLGILGRHHLLSKQGVANAESVRLFLNEQLLTVLSGVFFCSLALIIGLGINNLLLSICLFSSLGICIFFPKFLVIITKITSRYFPSKLSRLFDLSVKSKFHSNLLYAALGWLTQSMLFLLLLFFLVNPELTFRQWALLSGLQCVSVIAGLLAIFAPAGIGVRELVIVTLGVSILPKQDILVVVIAHRVVLMLWDFVIGLSGVATHLALKK